MIDFFKKNKKQLFLIFLCVAVWRLLLSLVGLFSPFYIQDRTGFLGPLGWANLDGLHYLSIATNGYFQFEQAFFPLFPLLINSIGRLLSENVLFASFFVVYVSFIATILLFYRLMLFDYKKDLALWMVVFLLAFPTSFFFVSIYTESLFMVFTLASFLFARRGRWAIAGIFGAFASATRLAGVLLLPALLLEFVMQGKKEKGKYGIDAKKAWGIFLVPLGLIGYMIYLQFSVQDPLAFVHAQPAFGANRSGGEIILLPQVIWRYIKIFLTVSPLLFDFWIALLEILTFVSVIVLLYLGYKKKVRESYLFFSLMAIALPTLSGTFSSIPRYALASFALFPALALIKNKKIRYSVLSFSIIVEVVLTGFFLRGYFIS